MKLYQGMGPNSYRVRIFMAEKGISLPMVDVDFAKGE
ncbi:MAG: glutathione S-transferase family protein, partial [Ensifer adhaerens]|nr:glutathione S-transferase family protein [Ensifer adhaerens]